MYFDELKNIKTTASKSLYETCIASEENARIRPNESVINTRKAIEIFTASTLADHGITIPSSIKEKQARGLENLDKQIQKCRNFNIITQEIYNLLDKMRKDANKIVHVKYNNAGDPEKYEISNTDADVKLASKLVKYLYFVMVKYFFKGKESLSFDLEYLPFGKYRVVELVEKIDGEASTGKYNYICKRIDIDENGKERISWVYIRVFEKNEEGSYAKRDKTVLNEVWDGVQVPENIVKGSIIETAQECSFSYIVYSINENTFTLVNQEKLGKITGLVALGIIEKLINALISIQEIKEGTKIHHRCIRPEFIFITPYRSSFNVSLGCFENAKIEKEDPLPTVSYEMIANQINNPFAPPEIRLQGTSRIDDVDWEKVDVYSLGILLLWILGSNVYKNKKHFDVLFEYYESDDFLRSIDKVLSNVPEERPSLNQLLEAVRKEMILIG